MHKAWLTLAGNRFFCSLVRPPGLSLSFLKENPVSNSFAPRATWITDEDLLEVFSIAYEIRKCGEQAVSSFGDNAKITIGEACDVRDEAISKLVAQIAKRKGADFSTQGRCLFWEMRSRHSKEVIVGVRFDRYEFDIRPTYHPGGGCAEYILGASRLHKKRNEPVINISTHNGGKGTHCGVFFKNGQRLSFFESWGVSLF